MAELKRYRSNILIYNTSTGTFQVGTSGQIYVFSEGASSSQAKTVGGAGDTLAVYDKGSFAVNDFAQLGLNGDIRQVTGAAAQLLTFGAVVVSGSGGSVVAVGDRILNIGTISNKSGSKATIYSDDQGTVQITQPLLCDASGNYQFYATGGDYDILERTSAGVNLAINQDVQIVGNTLIPDAGGTFDVGSAANYFANIYGQSIRGGTSQDLVFYRNSTTEVFRTAAGVEGLNQVFGSFWGRTGPTLALKKATPFVLGWDNLGPAAVDPYMIWDFTGSTFSGGTEWEHVRMDFPIDLSASTGITGSRNEIYAWNLRTSVKKGPDTGQTHVNVNAFKFNRNFDRTNDMLAFAGNITNDYCVWARYSQSGTATHTGTVTNSIALNSTMTVGRTGGSMNLTNIIAFRNNTDLTSTGTINSSNVYGISQTMNHSGSGHASGSMLGFSNNLNYSAGTISATLSGISTIISISGTVNPATGYGHFANLTKSSTGTLGTGFGEDVFLLNSGTGTITTAYGARIRLLNTSTGVVTTGRALQIGVDNSGAGTFTTAYGLEILGNTVSGTIGTWYQIQVASPASLPNATTYYGINIAYPAAQVDTNQPHVQLRLVPRNMAGVAVTAAVLPTPSSALEGSALSCSNTAGNNTNGLYVCFRNSSGVYKWYPVSVGAAL